MSSPAPVVWSAQEEMVGRVARALGNELTTQMAFVGGCATALLVTDPFTKSSVRFTDDVDLIVQVISRADWVRLEKVLLARAFATSPEDDILCRRRLRDGQGSELIVDFMPDDAEILGFTNQWYAEALDSATDHPLPDGTVVRVVSSPYFLATKLQAYLGRGNNDPMASRDIEDILNLIDGRDSLIAEFALAPSDVRSFVAAQLNALITHRDFDYAVQACARNAAGRENLIYERIEAVIQQAA